MVIFVMNLVKIAKDSFFPNILASIFGIFTLIGGLVIQNCNAEKYLITSPTQARLGMLWKLTF